MALRRLFSASLWFVFFWWAVRRGLEGFVACEDGDFCCEVEESESEDSEEEGVGEDGSALAMVKTECRQEVKVEFQLQGDTFGTQRWWAVGQMWGRIN